MKTKNFPILVISAILCGFAVTSIIVISRFIKGYAERSVSSTYVDQNNEIPSKLPPEVIVTPNSLNHNSNANLPPPAQQGYVASNNKSVIQSKIDSMKSDYLARNIRPMFFYGLVLDEQQQPVYGANILFSETYTGKTPILKTDFLGRFDLSGVTGRYLSVEVTKEGYYKTKKSRQSFDYSPEGGNFQADFSKPIVFYLNKKGLGVDLITSQQGVQTHIGVSGPRDGSPIWINFFSKKFGADGQMEIGQVKPAYENWKQAISWSYRLAIPNGGFVETSDEFPFQAPESGYQPNVEFNFQKSDTNWSEHLDKTYYVEFGNPPQYGRIHIQTSISTGTMLEYAINPSGSRNLEPK